MQLVKTAPPPATELGLLPDTLCGEAANDAPSPQARRCVADINVLVASVVGKVTARVRPRNVNVSLSLAAGSPMITCVPHELVFAISGILSALLRSMDEGEGEGELLQVETRVDKQGVRVAIASDGVPPLRYIRAITGQVGEPGTHDPTIAHCRRIIEAQGGALALTDEHGLLGFAMVFPPLPLTTVRLLPRSLWRPETPLAA